MANSIVNAAINASAHGAGLPSSISLKTNVGDNERVASIVCGAAIAAWGFHQKGIWGFALPVLGGLFAFRGVSGYCSVYDVLGVDTSRFDRPDGPNASVAAGQGVRVEEKIFVNRPPDELYDIWSQVELLPRFMSHIRDVRMSGDHRSHWIAEAPLGLSFEWDAEVYYHKPGRMITWRSRPGGDVDTAGSVHFKPVDGGTMVHVNMKYDPPAGKTGIVLTRLFGQDATRIIREELRRFKAMVEADDDAGVKSPQLPKAS